MSNYTTLQENTMYGLSESASILYLKLLDVLQGYVNRLNERKAFLAACHYDDECGDVLDYILSNYPQKISDKVKSELSDFFSERWRYNFMEKQDGIS